MRTLLDGWVSSPLLEATGWTLLHFLWQGGLLSLGAMLCLYAARRASPSTRYLVACAFFFAMPLSVAVTFACCVPEADSSPEETVDPFNDHVVLRETVGGAAPLARSEGPAPSTVRPGRGMPPAPGAPAPRSLTVVLRDRIEGALPALVGLWLAGVALFSARLTAGLYGARRLRRRLTVPLTDAPWRTALARLLARTGVRRSVRLVASGLARTPAVLGAFKPVILVPAGIVAGLTPAQIEALLAHELAHIRRHDYLVNLLQMAVETLLFYHPAVWWLSRRIRAEREHCCDDAAVALCGDALVYARTLAALEALRLTPVAMGAAGPGLLGRVRRVLGLSSPARPWYARARTGVAPALGLVLGAALSAAAYASTPPRWVHLPEDAPAGALFVRDAGAPYDAGWTFLAAAQGSVKVPRGMELRFVATPPRQPCGCPPDPDDEESASNVPPPAAVERDLVAALSRGNMSEAFFDHALVDGAALEYLASLPTVRSLVLEDAKLPPEALAAVGRMTRLENLNLEGTGPLAVDLGAVGGLTSLKALQIGWTDADDLTLTALSGLRNLERLDLEKTKVEGPGLAWLAPLPRLRRLDLHQTPLGPQAGAALSLLRTLTWLDLKETGADDALLRRLDGLDRLVSLDLSNNNVTDRGLAALSGLPSLRHLSLRGNPVGDEGMAAIGALTGLTYLDISDTHVSDVGMARLSGLRNLRVLKADGTALTPEGRDALVRRLPRLRELRYWATPAWDRDPPKDRPRVGVIFSHYSRTGPHWRATPYTYAEADLAAHNLIRAGFDVYAAVEPGTESLIDLPDMLRKHRLENRLVDLTSAADLAGLDCLLCYKAPNLREETLEAILDAVRAGMGFVGIDRIAGVAPTIDHPRLRELYGLEEPRFRWNFGFYHCEVLEVHPILGDLKPGDLCTLETLEGYKGHVIDGVPLLGAPKGVPYFAGYCPLYVRTYGAGRIVIGQWSRWNSPDALERAGGNYSPDHVQRAHLMDRCVTWASGR